MTLTGEHEGELAEAAGAHTIPRVRALVFGLQPEVSGVGWNSRCRMAMGGAIGNQCRRMKTFHIFSGNPCIKLAKYFPTPFSNHLPFYGSRSFEGHCSTNCLWSASCFWQCREGKRLKEKRLRLSSTYRAQLVAQHSSGLQGDTVD